MSLTTLRTSHEWVAQDLSFVTGLFPLAVSSRPSVLERVPEHHLFLRLRTVCPCLYVRFACLSSVDAHGSLPPRAVVNHTAGTFWYKDPLVFNSLAKYPEVEKQERVAVLC